MQFALVHSPAVGPATWEWVAGRLRSMGHEVVVPDLVGATRSGDPVTFVQSALEVIGSGDDFVVVGHSGAGPLLPLISARCAPAARLTVWVDGGLPPCDDPYTIGGNFVDTLRGLAVDGLLPQWSMWFGEGLLDRLVGDEPRRERVERELPQVPLAFYESPITPPPDWCRRPGAFVLLSENYRSDADRAASLGWPVVEQLGAHLDIVNQEAAIAATLVELAGGTSRQSFDTRSK